MSWLQIIHETTYRYKKPVDFGPHRLVLRPREGHDVHIEKMIVEIEPEFELTWSRDLFGNCVAIAHISGRADRLHIRSEVLLHQTAPFPQRSLQQDAPAGFPVRFSEMESAIAAAYLTSSYPTEFAEVEKWINTVINPTALGDAEDIVASVAATIRNRIKYLRREARGVQSPSFTLSTRSGSCRDMATLMLEALRSLGFPTRFVSGYLECSASEAGCASTHAWAEAYLPSVGWIGYDPMLGQATSSEHIVVGVSSHPRAVMPVSGTFFDEDNSYLGMEVTVRTMRFSEFEALPVSLAAVGENRPHSSS